MNLQMFGSRLLVRPLDGDEAVESAFLQPDQMKQRCQKGEVVAIGPTVEKLKVGDTVLFSMYAPKETVVGGERYVILLENDDEIFAIL